MYRDGEEDEDSFFSSGEQQRDEHDDGYYDELELDFDESLLEGLIILTLAATLMALVYWRQQRVNQRPNDNQNANANAAGQANVNNQGFFPRPGDPEFPQWVAGGVGH